MNKRGYFLGILFTLIILSSTLISAAGEAEMARDIITKGMNAVLGFVNPVLEKVLGDYQTSEFFFAKVLLLLLLILISNGILRKTPIGKDNAKVSIIVASIISILAVRFIGQNSLIESILIPYGTLGVAITTLLPFIIFFYFIHNSGIKSTGRKMAWYFFMGILILIWIYQSKNFTSPMGDWIYIIIVGIAIGCLIFDKDLHYYFGSERLHKVMERIDDRSERLLLRELDDLRRDAAYGRKSTHHDERVKEIQKELKTLGLR